MQGLGVEPPDWEACSFELARTLADAASRDLASAQLSQGEKARAVRLAMCFQWAKEAIRGAGAARISAAARRAMRCPHAKDLARKWRAWLHGIWFVPLEPSAADPRKWWNLTAAAGLLSRASEEQWKKLCEELRGIRIFAPSDLAERGQDQLHIVTEDPRSNRLLGQL